MRALGVFPRERAVRVVEHDPPRIGSATDVRLGVLEVGVCGTDREICRFEFGAPPAGWEHLVLGHECLAEVLRARGRRSELEAADLAIGSAHADLQHAQADVGGGADARRIVLDDADRALAREDAQRLHRLRPSHHRKSAFTVGVSRVRL